MSFRKSAQVTLIILSSFVFHSLDACTIFSLYPNGQHWVGRTYDWSFGHGLVFTNARNVTKSSVRLLSTDVVSSWTSKYGSVTFNQFGKEFPNGGMNEAGLVIDALELKSSIFPITDTRASLNELQFIQYILDNFATVEEAAKNIANIRLAPVGSKLHYFACDVSKCMSIEFINGELVTHLNSNLPISSLANNTYEESAAYAKKFITFGGNEPIVLESKESLNRFVRASYNAKTINESEDKIQTIFTFLEDVGSANNRWQLIYNQDEKIINFRTHAKLDKQRKIDLSKIDFNCHSESKYFDLESEVAGPINSELKSFDFDINLANIKKSVELQKLPSQLANVLGYYPNGLICN